MTRLLQVAGLAALVTAAAALVLPVSAFADSRTIKMRDDCDPTTFNIAVPATPPTCVGDGKTLFGNFIGQLLDHKFAAEWRFSPDHITIEAGRSLRLDNHGGETHTLTPVSQFGGGGIAPPLNFVLFGTFTPPTFFTGPHTFVPSGGRTTIDTSTLTPGRPYLFICAIHPWMHETVVVENDDDD
jgi:plastocyanin